MNAIVKILMIVVLCCFVFISWSISNADGADWRVWTNNGGMSISLDGQSEGHKSYHQFGLEGIFDVKGGYLTGGADAWFRGEPADEDPEVPQIGWNANATYLYNIEDQLLPYLGVQWSHIANDHPTHYPEGSYDEEFDMALARFGARVVLEPFWVNLGTQIPFYSSSKSGNFGADVGIGFTWKRLDVGYKFKQIILTDHHFSGNASMEFYWSGLEIGYTF